VAQTSEEAVRNLTTLSGELKKLETEYNQFFSGRLPRPPWETRTRVESLIRKWDRESFEASAIDKFKFQTLQARYATFADLWDRGLRARARKGGRVRSTGPRRGRPSRPSRAIRPCRRWCTSPPSAIR
jgi:hypothetical protein